MMFKRTKHDPQVEVDILDGLNAKILELNALISVEKERCKFFEDRGDRYLKLLEEREQLATDLLKRSIFLLEKTILKIGEKP